MLATLAISLLFPLAPPMAVPYDRADDPPIRLRLSDDNLVRGDRARVKVRTAEDGYLLVLRLDADGRVRVLYPLDPEDDGRWRGGREGEIHGRGDREAFTVSEHEGGGTLVAARSDAPFRFDDVTRNGHWDYRALADTASGDDAETRLLDLVERMSTTHYDYDVVHYTVSARDDVGGHGRWYGPHYSAYYLPCIGCGPGYGPGFGFRFGLDFGRPRPFWGRRW
ncbi:MAG: DUF4384 domain-containing protein [Gemmatimonadales bacterium]